MIKDDLAVCYSALRRILGKALFRWGLYIILLVSLSACSPQGHYRMEMQKVLVEWDDAVKVAASTGRIALSAPVARLQEIKRKADSITVSSRFINCHPHLVKYMEATIDGFLEFMRDGETDSIKKALEAQQEMTQWINCCSGPKEVSRRNTDEVVKSYPVYLVYYQAIREKIGKVAYNGYNRAETGEIYLEFIVKDDGSVNDIRVVEGKSSASAYLRKIAIEAVKNAAPFSVFPSELKYSQLKFSTVLSYEIK